MICCHAVNGERTVKDQAIIVLAGRPITHFIQVMWFYDRALWRERIQILSLEFSRLEGEVFRRVFETAFTTNCYLCYIFIFSGKRNVV